MKNYSIRPRIKSFDYTGHYGYFLTLCTFSKQTFFNSCEIVTMIIDELKTISNKHAFDVHAYSFMPDHLHLLVTGRDSQSNLKKFIKDFKQSTGFLFNKQGNDKLWQTSFYDHVLRNDESIKDIAQYIWNNHVRKGMVKNFMDYPFNGSFVFNLTQINL